MRLSESLYQINCGGKQFHVSYDNLFKLPLLEKNGLAKWNPNDEIRLCRNPKYFAAMIKHLQGYPLKGKEFARARHELAFFGYELEGLQIDEPEIKIAVFADLKTKPNIIAIKKRTLELLPLLRESIAAGINLYEGLPIIKCTPLLGDCIIALQCSLAMGESLTLQAWHHLHKNYDLRQWPKISIFDLEFNVKDIGEIVFEKTVQLSWSTGDDGLLNLFCFDMLAHTLRPGESMRDIFQPGPKKKPWRLVNPARDAALLKEPRGSCLVCWTCYDDKDLEPKTRQ